MACDNQKVIRGWLAKSVPNHYFDSAQNKKKTKLFRFYQISTDSVGFGCYPSAPTHSQVTVGAGG